MWVFCSGKYSDGSSPSDEWFKQGKMMKAHPVSGSGEKAKDPVFGLTMGAASQASADVFSQLKSSFTYSVTRGLVTPKGISGAPFRLAPSKRAPRFTVKAVQADEPTFQVIQPINGDPFIGSLETPVTSSPLIA
ncbi:hypothetical protein Pint_03119 [Pistacia integerrima]|uniref:Uncharacterized protein n=3 Tax=Pistacia integerrima TaxID=434235 RepID=A0ACC0ZI63_9ROSI|nr:hypothetical protein Pint_03113 [Pistacia integerrima]KAJ0051725.1 hypothetical protein Pint_03117 [Pistacia integerrima]KAJ0051728.1 hypothetical protein Pint_03119 [Pistacia integerrima]